MRSRYFMNLMKVRPQFEREENIFNCSSISTWVGQIDTCNWTLGRHAPTLWWWIRWQWLKKCGTRLKILTVHRMLSCQIHWHSELLSTCWQTRYFDMKCIPTTIKDPKQFESPRLSNNFTFVIIWATFIRIWWSIFAIGIRYFFKVNWNPRVKVKLR